MKVGEKTNFGRLATIFQICSMDADILSVKYSNCLTSKAKKITPAPPSQKINSHATRAYVWKSEGN